eukprot:8963795-Pyramimonas_sp.AAC.1
MLQLLPQALRRPCQEELDARRPREQVLVAGGAREQRVELQPPVAVLRLAVPRLVAAAIQDHAWATSTEGGSAPEI